MPRRAVNDRHCRQGLPQRLFAAALWPLPVVFAVSFVCGAEQPKFSVVDLLDMPEGKKLETLEKMLDEPNSADTPVLIEILGEDETLPSAFRSYVVQELSFRLTEEDLDSVRVLAEKESVAASVCGLRLLPYCHTPKAVPILEDHAGKGSPGQRTAAILSLSDAIYPESLQALGELNPAPGRERAALEWARSLLSLRLGKRNLKLFSADRRPAVCGMVGLAALPGWLGGFWVNSVPVKSPGDLRKILEGDASARILVILPGQASDALLGSAEAKEVLRGILGSGGKVWVAGDTRRFDTTTRVFEDLGAEPPGELKAVNMLEVVPEIADLHPICIYPTDLAARRLTLTASGSWGSWQPSQAAPFRAKETPDRAALVIQDGVQEKGTVVFSLLNMDSPFLSDNIRCLLLPPELQQDCPWYYDISEEGRTPHFEWAKPLREPVKALFLMPEGPEYYSQPLKRLPVELSQRMTLRYDFVPIREILLNQVKREMMLHNLTRLGVEAVLGKNHEAIVINNQAGIYGDAQAPYLRAWTLFTPELKRLLLGRVYLGAGLFLGGNASLVEQARADMKLRTEPLPSWLEKTVPSPPKILWAPYGKGKVVFMGGIPAPDCVMDELYYGLLCRLVLWASGRLPSPKLRPPDTLPKVSYEGGKGADLVALDAAINTLSISYHDGHALTLSDKVEAQKAVNLYPQLPEGKYAACIKGVSGEGVEDFCSVSFSVSAPARVRSIELAKPYCLCGEPVSGVIKLEGEFTGLKLIRRLLDGSGRLLDESTIEARADSAFSLAVGRPLTDYHEIEASLADAQGRIASRQVARFVVHRPLDVHRMRWCLWGGNGTPALKAQVGMDHVMGTLEDVRAGLGICSTGPGPGIGQPKGTGGIRTPELSRPSFREAVRANMERAAERYAALGQRLVLLEDECGHGVFERSPSALIQFRSRLKKTYGTLERLNTAWQTKFATWDAVVPMSLEEAQKHTSLAPWMDHMEFVDWVYAEWLDLAEAAMRERIPDGRVGLSSFVWPELPGGADPWKMSRSYGFVIGISGFPDDYMRCFGRPDLIWGAWVRAPYDASDSSEGSCRWELWDYLFRGANAVGYFAQWCLFRTDLSMMNTTRWTKEEMDEIRSGVDHLVLGAKPDNNGVALYYSHPSWRLSYALGDGTPGYNPNGYKALLAAMRLSYDLLSVDQLLTGKLRYPDYRLLILPTNLVATEAEARAMESFVSAGGRLVADFQPGIYDEHGVPHKHSPLSKLFGVQGAFRQVGKNGELTSAILATTVPVYVKDLECSTGKPNASIGQTPALVTNEIGKGKAWLLNVHPAVVKDGLKIMEALLGDAGVERPFVLSGDTNGVRTYHFVRGNSQLVGISCRGRSDRIEPQDKRTLELRFPRKWHIYEVRRRKYLGELDALDFEHVPNVGQLFALLPSRAERIELRAETRLPSTPAGEPAKPARPVLELRARIVAQIPPDRPVIRFELFSPSGRHERIYDAIVEASGPEGTAQIPIAINAPAGQWRIAATDVATGLHAEQTVVIEGRP